VAKLLLAALRLLVPVLLFNRPQLKIGPADTFNRFVFHKPELLINMLENLSSKQLNRAAQLKEKIETLESELQALLGGSAPATSTAGQRSGTRTISAAGKARIAAAQRARWAKARGSNGTASTSSAPKGRRRMSPAARAKLAKAARARWAKAKAAGKSSL